MVHALREAHRVLKPRGLLVDLRPADQDRQVFSRARAVWKPLGRILVNDADVRAADRALERAVDRGLYHPVSGRAFRVRRHFLSPRDWREYVDDLSLGRPGPGLLENARQAFRLHGSLVRIVVEMGLTLRVLKKA